MEAESSRESPRIVRALAAGAVAWAASLAGQLAACGGGGGASGRIERGCEKVCDCLDFSGSSLVDCVEECVDDTKDEGGISDDCADCIDEVRCSGLFDGECNGECDYDNVVFDFEH